MAIYYCEIRMSLGSVWRAYGSGAKPVHGKQFDSPDEALVALWTWHRKHRLATRMTVRVVRDEGCATSVVWEGSRGALTGPSPPTATEGGGIAPAAGTSQTWVVYDECHTITTTAGGNKIMHGDIAEPLHIPREALIGRLEEVRQEEIDRREEAQKAAAAARQTLLDKVEKLTTDQVANMLHNFVNSNVAALEEWIDNVQKESKFVSKDIEPTSKEHQLDKTIRVLQLASDKEVEIKPSDPVFPLL